MLKPAVGDGVFSAEYLVVGGGGAGGLGGGGGAGGYLESLASFTANVPYAVTIGNGGISTWRAAALYNEDGNGKNSSIVGDGRSIIALGGGSGATNYIGNGGGLVSLNGNSYKGATGGSGGGSGGNLTAAGQFVAGGLGTAGQGNRGGGGSGTGGSPSGGGGGAGSPGGDSAGAGGVGKRSSIITAAMASALKVGQLSGQDIYFAGGGGGGSHSAGSGLGGLGGGGAGTFGGGTGTSGVANTGGGGGGNCGAGGSSGNGGSGVVIIAYPSALGKLSAASGSLVYTVDTTSRPGYRIYIFTAGSGNITFSATPTTFNTEYLLVAGGGGGGAQNTANGGGSGGGVLSGSLTLSSYTAYDITIGAGGESNLPGSNTVAFSLTALGGSAGGTSGPGAGGNFTNLGGPSAAQFNAGGNGDWAIGSSKATDGKSDGLRAGGGGGAGGAVAGRSGSGGSGVMSYISNSPAYKMYSGGGGGSQYSALGAPGLGGLGGGGAGANQSSVGVSGTANTGGGGGGQYSGGLGAGTGGSGVVVVACPVSTDIAVTVSNTLTYTVDTTSRTGYRVYTFTSGYGTVTFV